MRLENEDGLALGKILSYLDTDGALKGRIIEKVGSEQKLEEIFASLKPFEELKSLVEDNEQSLRDLSELLDEALQKASQQVSTTAE